MRSIRRRRNEQKTDYKARLALLKSDLPRLVIRKTNRYITAQLVKSEVAQDSTIAFASSKELLKLGWKEEGNLKNKSASYLTGQLIAKKLKGKFSGKLVLDLGMNRNVHKSRLYYVAKGALDGGLSFSASQEALPSKEDLNSEEIKLVLGKMGVK